MRILYTFQQKEFSDYINASISFLNDLIIAKTQGNSTSKDLQLINLNIELWGSLSNLSRLLVEIVRGEYMSRPQLKLMRDT